jgi:Ca-activated chloride channel family protein
MTFVWGYVLWFFLLIPVLVFLYIFLWRRKKKYTVRYSSVSIIKASMDKGPSIRRHIPAALFLVALAAMVFATSRPVGTLLMPSPKGTVILAIDVSLSMGSIDIKPNRLEAAKSAAKDFISKQPSDVQIGIVSVCGLPTIVQAPTTDRELLFSAVNGLSLQERTAIGDSILTAFDAISEGTGMATLYWSDFNVNTSNSTRNNVKPDAIIILMSDGQSNTGLAPTYVADEVTGLGIPIYTVGIGSSGSKNLSYWNYRYMETLDEQTLVDIAYKTDGQYFRAENATSLHNIYDRLGRKTFFKSEATELTAEFTGLAAALMIIAGVLSLIWFHRVN